MRSLPCPPVAPPPDLLRALTAERYDNRWWTRRQEPDKDPLWNDSDLATARRRRALANDFNAACDRRAL
jgi:hypothetical protein